MAALLSATLRYVQGSKETYFYGKRDLLVSIAHRYTFAIPSNLDPRPPERDQQKRPNTAKEPSQSASRETYSYGKRDLFLRQKRPISKPKETYS